MERFPPFAECYVGINGDFTKFTVLLEYLRFPYANVGSADLKSSKTSAHNCFL